MGGLTKRCGCRKREWSRCRHPWHFACQWKGRRYRVSLDAYVGRPLRGKTEAETEVDRLQNLRMQPYRYGGIRLGGSRRWTTSAASCRTPG